ncbi:hypothetical protein LXL04_012184 [Taraxacum kok-saghyz]
MGGKKRSKQKFIEKDIKESSTFTNYSAPARNLRKTDLGAVIFGCKHTTINECLANNLFGLPASHFSYIKNIKEGVPLFLFNYSDRKLHGVFEATSPGQMNLNRYAWLTDDDNYAYTSYPAQVRVRVRQQCHPLSESQFGPIIEKNYYEKQHFYFELDNDQTKKLISLFTSSPVNIPLSSFPVSVSRQTPGPSYASTTTTTSFQQPTGTWSSLFKSESNFKHEDDRDKEYEEDKSNFTDGNTWEDAECDKTWESDWCSEGNMVNEDTGEMLPPNTWEESETAVNEAECVQTLLCNEISNNTDDLPSSSSQPLDDNLDRQVSSSSESDVEENKEEEKSLAPSINLESLVVKLMQEVELLKGSHLKQTTDINLLEQELDKSKLEIQHLRNRFAVLKYGSQSVIVDPVEVEDSDIIKHHTKVSKSVFLFGGYDGSSWLPCLDSYHPSYDIKIPLNPMNSVKMNASAAAMNGELYHFGGGKVESYNPTFNQWVIRPPSYWSNIHVAGASVDNKLFVVGGSKDRVCSSEVEYLDLNLGKWFPFRSMNSKRLAPAAAEINNVLYVSGGYDGKSYSSSLERLDPREEKWSELADMNKRRGCHSMVVLNEKLYALGGFDGEKYVENVECLDTRMGSWVESEPMKVSRACFGAFVVGEYLYAIGGLQEDNKLLDIVECYKEGSSWEVINVNAIGKRSHFSAIVL